MDTTQAFNHEAARQERGRRIAERMRIRKSGRHSYIVPSESRTTSYVVKPWQHGTMCTCPDFETRRLPCKHIFAVEYARQAVVMPDGSTAVTETLRVKRITYPQNWPAYNFAQTREKERALELLAELCAGITESPRERKRGNQPLSTRDRVFAIVAKVYGGMSSRRTDTDMRDYRARGFLSRPVSYNAVCEAMEDAALTPILSELVTQAALPLKAVESQFAIDATGFSTLTYKRWFDHKWGREKSEQQWVKAHAIVGVRTNVICGARVTFGPSSDCTEFVPMLNATAPNFNMQEISADKAYGSYENLECAEAHGITPFVSFKMNARGDAPGQPPIWRKMFHYFQMERDQYLAHYHQRSNVEATFSMVKRKFGAALRSKTDTAQINEVLAKFLAHNLAVLVHESYEMGVAPMFWQEPDDDLPPPLPACQIHPLPAESGLK